MIDHKDCQRRYGKPGTAREGLYMSRWPVPDDILEAFAHVRYFPEVLYCNNDLKKPLEDALRNLMIRGLTRELKTWDGCYNFRAQRASSLLSLHSWAVAIDLNADTNRLGHKPTLSSQFVDCFTDAGFDWGGVWRRPDGMHFQLASLPN